MPYDEYQFVAQVFYRVRPASVNRVRAAARIHLERLPGYAPELNPDEGIWRYLKRVELRNLACRDLSHLRVELCKATPPAE